MRDLVRSLWHRLPLAARSRLYRSAYRVSPSLATATAVRFGQPTGVVTPGASPFPLAESQDPAVGGTPEIEGSFSRLENNLQAEAVKQYLLLEEVLAGLSSDIAELSQTITRHTEQLAVISEIEGGFRRLEANLQAEAAKHYFLLEEAVTSMSSDVAGLSRDISDISTGFSSNSPLASELREHRTRLQNLKETAELMDRRAADRSALAVLSMKHHADHLVGLYAALRPTEPLGAFGGWRLEPDSSEYLYRAVRELRPSVVVEVGSGLSSLIIAAALRTNGTGRLLALEHDEHYAAVTTRELAQHDLGNWASVLEAPLRQTPTPAGKLSWYDIDELAGKIGRHDIDLLLVDGPPASTGHLARYPALPVLADLIRPGATILLDDAARPDEDEVLQRWTEEYPGMESHQLQMERPIALLKWPEMTTPTIADDNGGATI